MGKITPLKAFILAIVPVIAFLGINFNPDIRETFSIFIIFTVVYVLLDKRGGGRLDFPIINRHHNPRESILFTVGGYSAFIVASTLVAPILGSFIGVQFATIGLEQSLSRVPELFSELILFFSQQAPALAENQILVFVTWGVLIPIAETLFFVTFFEALTDLPRISDRKASMTNPSTILLVFFVSAIFAAFHLTAKGIGSAADEALIVTFIFMAITLFLVLIRRQSIEAIMLHIAANMIAISVSLGVGLSIPLTTAAVLFGLFMAISNKNIIKIVT